MTTPNEVWARGADARLRAVAPELYRSGHLKPHAWSFITKFGVVVAEPDEDAGFAARRSSHIAIEPDALDFLLGCAERLAALGGNAPALSGEEV